jgi:hypothetical protein
MPWKNVRDCLYFFVAFGRYTRKAAGDGYARQNNFLNTLTRRLFTALPLLVLSKPDEEGKPVQQLTLPNILALTSAYKASDPRDHIISLLGLLPQEDEVKKFIIPDYSKDVAKLYIEFAEFFIKNTRKLDILGARMIKPAEDRAQYSVPSWVPDWANSYSLLNSISLGSFSTFRAMCQFNTTWAGETLEDHDFSHVIGPMFSASASEESAYDFEFQGYQHEVLIAHGITVDRIKEKVSNPLIDPPTSTAEESTLKSWQALCPPDLQGKYPFANHSWKEAFWRTVLIDRSPRCGETIAEVQRLPPDMAGQSTLGLFRHNYIGPPNFPPEAADEPLMIQYLAREYLDTALYNGFTLHSVGQHFFVTEKGYIGVGSPLMETGDIIVILFGGSVPFILRQQDEYYKFISERYVL